MCKKMPVIPVDRVVDKKRIIGKRRAEEEKSHKGSLTHKKTLAGSLLFGRKNRADVKEDQGRQRVYFQTKNPNLGKFFRALQ
jgi:hypothetical protein